MAMFFSRRRREDVWLWYGFQQRQRLCEQQSGARWSYRISRKRDEGEQAMRGPSLCPDRTATLRYLQALAGVTLKAARRLSHTQPRQ
jgi:hypothetical protein